MSGQEFFKKVFPDQEKDKVIQDFVHSGQDLYTKISESQHLLLRPFLLKNESFLCRLVEPAALTSKTKIPSSVVHNFILNGDRFYFKGKISHEGNLFEIFTQEDLFQLQRRQSYRVVLPEHMQGRIEIEKVGSKQISLKGKLIDLSLGGCAWEVLTEMDFEIDELIELTLSLNGKIFLKSKGRVRRTKQTHGPKGPGIFVGIEFVDPTPAQEQKIFNLTLDIHRETYGRLI